MRWLTKRKCNFNSGYEYLAAKKVKKKIQFLAKKAYFGLLRGWVPNFQPKVFCSIVISQDK